MAEGWSWDPTRPLGDRDSNAFWPSLMPAHQIANGSKPTVSTLFGHNENTTPPHAATLTGPSHHHARPAASPDAAPDASSPAQPEPASDSESKPKAPASRKRKSEAAPEEPAADDLPEISDDDPRLHNFDESANQVRNKIRRFIESGAMKIGEFQDAIDVSAASYRRFMNQTGSRQGEGSDAYVNAFVFFKKRELQGLKAVPPKKKARASTGPKDTGKTEKQKAAELLDVSDVTLEGEEEGDVPVFDTCDELRKKIRAFLKRDGATQAGLCRAISALLPGDQTVQARQMTTWLGKKGPVQGNTSPIFYGGYIFFEKLRIKENKKKSKFREEMEEIYKAGSKKKSMSHRPDGKAGISTERDLGGGLWMAEGERLTEDKYGQLDIIRVGRK